MFPERGWTKLDLANHYVLCLDGALRGVRSRPCMLKRWPRGVGAPPFFQKRAPKGAPTTDVLRQATEKPVPMFTPLEPADVLAMVQLGCVDLNPWTIRRRPVAKATLFLHLIIAPSGSASCANSYTFWLSRRRYGTKISK